MQLARERSDLLETLDQHHGVFIRQTAQSLTDEQATPLRTNGEPTLYRRDHQATESVWADFIVRGPEANGPMDENTFKAHARASSWTGMSRSEDFSPTMTRWPSVPTSCEDSVASLDQLS